MFWGKAFGAPAPPPPSADILRLRHTDPKNDADKDGLTDPFDVCENQPEDDDGFESDDGCPDPDNDRDGIADTEDKAPDAAEVYNGYQDEDGVPDVVPQRVLSFDAVARSIQFEKNRTRSTRDDSRRLETFVTIAKLFPDMPIEVVGHSDQTGDANTQIEVSQKRADAIERVLVRLGIPRERLSTRAAGATELVRGNSDDVTAELSRRVVVNMKPGPELSENGEKIKR